MENRISIVIPIYNRGYCLPRCLDSVLEQTFTDWECILVDDASTDNSLQVCYEYVGKDSRFRVFGLSENGGVSMARNRGIDLAKGEYIAFIDSDDWIEPDYLSVLYRSAGVKIMSLCEMIVHNKNGEVCKIHKLQDRIYKWDNSATDFILEHFRSGLLLGPCCCLYSRMTIEEHYLRFQSGISWGEDLIFNCSYYEYIEGIKCVSTFYHVMMQEVSLSSSFRKDPLLIDTNMKIWHSVYTFFEKKGIRNKEVDSFLQNYHFYILWEPMYLFYVNTGPSVSIKERLNFIRYVINNVDRRVIKSFFIPKNKRQLIFYLVYCRRTILLWLFWELQLLKKKYITNQ